MGKFTNRMWVLEDRDHVSFFAASLGSRLIYRKSWRNCLPDGWINAYPIQMHQSLGCSCTKAPGWGGKWVLKLRAASAQRQSDLLIFPEPKTDNPGSWPKRPLQLLKSRSSWKTTCSCKTDLRTPSTPHNNCSDQGPCHMAKGARLPDSRINT